MIYYLRSRTVPAKGAERAVIGMVFTSNVRLARTLEHTRHVAGSHPHEEEGNPEVVDHMVVVHHSHRDPAGEDNLERGTDHRSDRGEEGSPQLDDGVAIGSEELGHRSNRGADYGRDTRNLLGAGCNREAGHGGRSRNRPPGEGRGDDREIESDRDHGAACQAGSGRLC